jgi:hypothetical protein
LQLGGAIRAKLEFMAHGSEPVNEFGAPERAPQRVSI